MANGFRKEPVWRDNLTDTTLLGLAGAFGVTTVSVGSRVFVYIAAPQEDAIGIFELQPQGTLVPLDTVRDDAALALNGVANLLSFTRDDRTFIYANSEFDDSITVFEVQADGTLAFVQHVVDDATLELNQPYARMAVGSAGGVDYLIATGNTDDGLSVFSIAADGSLTGVANYDDASDVDFGLNGAGGVTTARVGAATYVFVAGTLDDAVTVFRLNAGGTLTRTDTVVDQGVLELNGAFDVATAVVAGTTYLFVSGYDDDGLSVFEVDAAGTLTNVFNLTDDAALALNGASGLTPFTLAGDTYLAVSGRIDDGVGYFRVEDDGSLTHIDTIFNTTGVELDGTAYNAVAVVDDRMFLINTANVDDGVSVFELGVSDLPINGTAGMDILSGTELDDIINGLAGNDILSGEGDDDLIDGGEGDDIIDGGAGNDELYGDGNQSQTLADTVTVPTTQQQLSLSVSLPEGSDASEIDITGFISRQPIETTKFNIVYVIDRSTSMNGTFSGTETVGDLNNDGSSNTLLDGTIAAYQSVTDSIIDAGLNDANVSIVTFGSDATTIYGGNVNAGVSTALQSISLSGSTNFEAALQLTIDQFINAGSGENRVFFMSDGGNNSGGSFTDEVATLLDANGIDAEIRAIGLGTSANLDQLDLIDDGIDNDSAERVLTPSELTAELGGTPVGSNEIDRIEVYVNGSLVETLMPGSFTDTPLGLQYSTTVSGLSTTANDDVEVRLIASDAAETTATVSIDLANLPLYAGDDVLLGHEGNDLLSGNRGNDRLLGGIGEDSLIGGHGNDLLDGGLDADRMVGGLGDDTYHVDHPDDVIVELAGQGNDTVVSEYSTSLAALSEHVENLTLAGAYNISGWGNALDNVITGNARHNTLSGEAGADQINGGGGWDTASYATSSGGVTVNLGEGSPESGGDAEGDVLTGIEHIEGSNHNDSLTGTNGINYLFGIGGHDRLNGAGGADRLDGGDGWDTAVYATSNAAVTVNLGDGLLESGGHAENDLLIDIEHVEGSVHSDTLIGDGGINFLSGGNGHDILEGRGGADRLVGGDGWDTARYAASAMAVVVNLGDGLAESGGDAEGDTLFFIEHVEGSAHSDSLTGANGVNFLYGNNGHDDLEGGGGADRVDGGNGWDTAVYASSNAAVTVSLGDGMLESGGHAEGDLLVGIEHVQGSAHSDTLIGDAGVNFLFGGGGHDILEGRGGADRLVGDDGWDTARYASSSAGVVVTLGDGLAESGGDAEGDMLFFIEHVEGSNHNDILTGASGVNFLYGNNGHDRLDGAAGADRLDGGSGWDTAIYTSSNAAVTVNLGDGLLESGGHAEDDLLVDIEHVEGSSHSDSLTGSSGINFLYGNNGHDRLEGAGGADRLEGGSGWDTAAYTTSDAAVTVNLGDGLAEMGGHAEGDLLVGIEHVEGSSFSDTLIGGSGVNFLYGGNGHDIMEGRAGADRIDGQGGWDTASYAGSAAGVTVDLSDGLAESGGDAAGDVLLRIERLTGSNHADALTGSSGINHIDGGVGNDYLAGGGGNDRLTGGADADTFHFETGDGDDMILDFEDGIDGIEIGPGATAFADLTITDSGADALVDFSDVSILVVGIDHTLLTTDDFTFV